MTLDGDAERCLDWMFGFASEAGTWLEVCCCCMLLALLRGYREKLRADGYPLHMQSETQRIFSIIDAY